MKIFDVIKYEGPNDVFVWKFPGEDFNTSSQLIVHESQEAVFFKDGEALDIFGPGRYTLHSQNIPLLRHIVNLPFNGVSPFHCEVYFINKVVSMDLRWATPNPVPVQDAKYNVIIPVRALGQFAIRVVESKKLLKELVGTIRQFDQNTVGMYFRGVLFMNIKDYIAKQLIQNKISILEIQSYLKKISVGIAIELQNEFDKYGLELVNFNCTEIVPMEDDPSYIQLKTALAKRAEMEVMGYSYQQARTFDVLDKAAANTSGGNGLMNAGIGLGMGAGVGGFMYNTMENMNKNIEPKEKEQDQEIICPKCHSKLPAGVKFCVNCGTKIEILKKGEIKCPHCHKIVKAGKFCSECGQKLIKECPTCGRELPDGAKFCMYCGTRIEE
ncbi:MAG TPA: SPFH domain-containing protein [Methanosphaera sp.]|nr:SPFH domain-containing protein [Methanosphaera sp.]